MIEEIIDELMEAFSEVSDETLSLWSAGKCIGGPEINLGVTTPKLCALILDLRREGMRDERAKKVR